MNAALVTTIGELKKMLEERDLELFYNNWYEFNDTNVSHFNIEDLEDEAFGEIEGYAGGVN